MDLTALMEVSSAKRLDALVTIVMDITALRWALFEILGVPTVIDILLFLRVRAVARTKLRIFLLRQ